MKSFVWVSLVIAGLSSVIANEAPLFKGKTFITTPEDTKVGTIIGLLSVVDPDGPEKLELNISDSATGELVKLGPVTYLDNDDSARADIILEKELDSDYHSTIRKLHFNAFDGDKTTSVTITLQIQDVNDNAPQFTQEEFTATVLSTVPVGSIVLIATAIDPDPTYGGVVQYKIQTDDLFAYQAFAVNKYTGMLTVKTPLVIKKGTDMHLKIVATDGGGLSTPVNVTISVQ